MNLSRDGIAWRIARDLHEGSYVNLGVGIPVLVSNYLEPNEEIFLHSENGILGVGPKPTNMWPKGAGAVPSSWGTKCVAKPSA